MSANQPATPFRTQVKIFFRNPEAIDTSAFAPLFQRWIQKQALEGLLIDVADYRHVFEGPGVILIGHESDYAIENRFGRLGLLYTCKRHTDVDLATHLRQSLRLALAACQQIEWETSFIPALKFRTAELEIRFVDRLNYPNKPGTFARVEEPLTAAMGDLYGTHGFSVEPVIHDRRYLFTAAVYGEDEADIAELLQNLKAPVQK